MDKGKLVGGCFFAGVAILLLTPILVIGTADWRQRNAIRSSLPAQLEAGSFLSHNSCDVMFGGYAFAMRMSPEAAKRLQDGGLEWLSATEIGQSEKNKAVWLPSEKLSWNYDGGTAGMYCFRYYEHNGQRVIHHMFRKGGYYAQIGQMTVYVIPSLALIVGGAAPSH